jgi:hypothetical protein
MIWIWIWIWIRNAIFGRGFPCERWHVEIRHSNYHTKDACDLDNIKYFLLETLKKSISALFNRNSLTLTHLRKEPRLFRSSGQKIYCRIYRCPNNKIVYHLVLFVTTPQIQLSDLMMLLSVAVLILFCISRCHSLVNVTYIVDDTPGYGRRFDGIGGLSGGGVSCKTTVTSGSKIDCILNL